MREASSRTLLPIAAATDVCANIVDGRFFFMRQNQLTATGDVSDSKR